MNEKIYHGLNPAQSEAVQTVDGPLLILAGAGSGKTRVLTHRVANIIASGKATATQILAVTFTNKAAREMEERTLGILRDLSVPIYDKLWIGTFHSTCARILREDIHLLDYQPFFAIYDDSDQLTQVKKVLRALNIDDKAHPAKSFQSRINEAKRLGLTPDDIEKKPGFFVDDMSKKVYASYETEMKKANALDFGDLLMKTYELFRMYPAVLEKYQELFRYILIDEYQDTNHIQYLLVKMLASKHRNLCVVGDEDQSIYSWRGADITNILSFESDFPEALIVKLEQNYRSTQTIVSAATHLIKNNSQRKDKTLFTDNDPGDKILVREENNEYDEARFVTDKIAEAVKVGGKAYSEVAIFYRTNAQSRVLEETLRGRKIPYKIVGGVKFYERMEIKNVLAYLKASINPADEVALRRIINVPARGIGKTTVQKIEAASIEHQLSFYDAISYVADHRLVHAGAARKLRHFREMMERLVDAAVTVTPSDLYLRVLDESQYAIRLKEENSPESISRLENLEEFDNALKHFEQERGEEGTLQNFLEEMALVSDADSIEDEAETVTLMTLHVSKGLEYPVVFLTGAEEGLFPSARSFESDDPEAIEEERRLAYVGMTRARENLCITHARSRRVWGQEQFHTPSRFLDEIPKQYINRQSAISRPSFMDRATSSSGDSPSGLARRSESFSAKRNKLRTSNDFSDFDEMPDYEDYDQTREADGYQKGMRVRHPTFGLGVIGQVEGKGQSQKVSVMFENQTMKKFIAKYARLELV